MLSNRLKIISDFVEKNDNVADIGCDHGFVLINLYRKNAYRKLLGIENKKGPYNTFIENLKKNNCFNSIIHSLSNGLDEVDSTYNCIILAGMGTDNIIKIIEKNLDKTKFFDKIIVDSHTNTSKLRRYICNKGFMIDKECFIVEDKIPYTIILFKRGVAKYTELEYKFGPIILKDKNDAFIEYCEEKLRFLKLKDSNTENSEFLESLKLQIKEIEGIINENKNIN